MLGDAKVLEVIEILLIIPPSMTPSRYHILCFKDAKSDVSDFLQLLDLYLLDAGLPDLIRHPGWFALNFQKCK
jgi:hypothetical protein